MKCPPSNKVVQIKTKDMKETIIDVTDEQV